MPEIKTDEDIFYLEKIMGHKRYVKGLIKIVSDMLLERGEHHDNPKLEEPEFSLFAQNIASLERLTFGSEEYENSRRILEKALVHHYANSRHHPEHHKNGIQGMNLIDIMEMFIDWYCASKMHHDGNIRKSIVENKKRFKFSDDLEKIFENSIELIDK